MALVSRGEWPPLTVARVISCVPAGRGGIRHVSAMTVRISCVHAPELHAGGVKEVSSAAESTGQASPPT